MMYSMNDYSPLLLSENSSSAWRHQFTCQGKCSPVPKMLCLVIYPHIIVMISSPFSIWSLSLPCSYHVAIRHLLCRSWQQWPVSHLKTVLTSFWSEPWVWLYDFSPDMFQKLSTVENQRIWVMESGAHRVNDNVLLLLL